jgi:hypothetical protein
MVAYSGVPCRVQMAKDAEFLTVVGDWYERGWGSYLLPTEEAFTPVHIFEFPKLRAFGTPTFDGPRGSLRSHWRRASHDVEYC